MAAAAALKSPTKIVEAVLPELVVGMRVLAMKQVGTIKFVGETKFSSGVWIGVALDKPDGKNDGAVQGVQYFTCTDKHGLFLRPASVIPEESGDSTNAPSSPDAPKTFNFESPKASRSTALKITPSSPSSSPETKLMKRRSQDVDGLLNGSIVVKGQNDMMQAVGRCTDEIDKLEAIASRLSVALQSALAREAAANELLAKAGQGQAPPTAPDGLAPTSPELEAWLDATSSKLGEQLEDRIHLTLQDSMAKALAEPLSQLHKAVVEVRKIKPAMAKKVAIEG